MGVFQFQTYVLQELSEHRLNFMAGFLLSLPVCVWYYCGDTPGTIMSLQLIVIGYRLLSVCFSVKRSAVKYSSLISKLFFFKVPQGSKSDINNAQTLFTDFLPSHHRQFRPVHLPLWDASPSLVKQCPLHSRPLLVLNDLSVYRLHTPGHIKTFTSSSGLSRVLLFSKWP